MILRQLTLRDWLLLIGLPLGTYAIAHALDLNELFQSWTSRHEAWQIDELLIIPIGFVMALTAVLVHHLQRLNQFAFRDPLTGLLNRRAFVDALTRRTNSSQENYTLLFIDLDGFKEINDQHGHREGDEVLVKVASMLLDSTPKEAIVSRLGGDEFCIMLPSSKGEEQAVALSDRIAASLAQLLHPGNNIRQISASVGIVLCYADQSIPSDPLRDADIAMYVAKRAGRANTVIFQPEMRPTPVTVTS